MRDWRDLLDEMTDVQRRVFSAGRATATHERSWGDMLGEQNLITVDSRLGELVGQAGCHGSAPEVGESVQRTIDQAAQVSAEQIAESFNSRLARAILEIADETPTANYRTYRSRLFGDTPNSIYPGLSNWASQDGEYHNALIATTETSSAINRITELFFKRNPDLDGPAKLSPDAAQCEICQAGVAGNPYPTMRAVYQAGDWPAHPGCIHYPESIGRVMTDDCGNVWKGED
jgi:hypothetical protein